MEGVGNEVEVFRCSLEHLTWFEVMWGREECSVGIYLV